MGDMLDGLEVLGPELGGIEEVSDIQAHAEIAAAAHFVEQIELFEILAGAVDPRDAVLVRPFHARAQRQKLFAARRLGNNLGDQVLSRLF